MLRRSPLSLLPPWLLTIVAMFLVQLASAFTVTLSAQVGAAGAAWLRVTMGAIFILCLARPPLRSLTAQQWPVVLALGVTTACMTGGFVAALSRISLGTTVAIAFLGPLVVAVFLSRSWRLAIWPGIALVGVLLLTRPWEGQVNLLGVAFASLSALGWAGYIIFTHKVGKSVSGLGGLALMLPLAALCLAVPGIPSAWGHITWPALGLAALLGLLTPGLAYILELSALRRMTPTAFGTLTALEPAFGLLLGFLILDQALATPQLVGIALVVLAGVASQIHADRQPFPKFEASAAEVVGPQSATTAGTQSVQAHPTPTGPNHQQTSTLVHLEPVVQADPPQARAPQGAAA